MSEKNTQKTMKIICINIINNKNITKEKGKQKESKKEDKYFEYLFIGICFCCLSLSRLLIV